MTRLVALLGAALLTALIVLNAHAQTTNIEVQVTQPGVAVPPHQFGIFFGDEVRQGNRAVKQQSGGRKQFGRSHKTSTDGTTVESERAGIHAVAAAAICDGVAGKL